ncbi:MAG: hypothetical protein Kow0090_18970 [Myxococcota bacterium]
MTFLFALLYPTLFRLYTGDKTARLTFKNSLELSPKEFEELAVKIREEKIVGFIETILEIKREESADKAYIKSQAKLLNTLESIRRRVNYDHIERFRNARIFKYEGAKTCLPCHQTVAYQTAQGGVRYEPLMENLINTSHFKLFGVTNEFSTFGYDGRQVNKEGRSIPVGKIDRACGIPGSFTWTGWAALVESKPAHSAPATLSEGCGQCHIGGMYGPPSDYMMPIHINDGDRRDGIDCLICHSRTYDMNQRYVIRDKTGLRWNQDRSMRAAMTVGYPTTEACLRCHQHNLGGDTYIHNSAAKALGYENPRILHAASKRGTPYHPEDDVHSKAGVECLDCHKTEGHRIARGAGGVDLVSNDLPKVKIDCETCHTASPHTRTKLISEYLNMHSDRVACQTCHITKLQENTIVLVDWENPVFNEEEGIWVPKPVLRSGDVRKAVGYLWYNGYGTFLANALGDNPSYPGNYNPLMGLITYYDKADVSVIPSKNGEKPNNFLSPLSPELLELRKRMVAENILPKQKIGKSKIYPFHLFNAKMFEDMNNEGPFGAMILPFDYKTYFETGNARKSLEIALAHPMVKRMYQLPFKFYMMDEFMNYFGILKGWNPDYPLDKDYPGEIKANWMRQMGTIALNHGITRRGFACKVCHTPEAKDALLDFIELGYPKERAEELMNLSELEELEGVDVGATFEELY